MYSYKETSFIELCAKGEVLLEEIDDFIDRWHKNSQDIELHEFLGMSWQEYSAWVAEPEILPFIVTARFEQKEFTDVLEELQRLPMAARADSPKKAEMILKWLKRKGKL